MEKHDFAYEVIELVQELAASCTNYWDEPPAHKQWVEELLEGFSEQHLNSRLVTLERYRELTERNGE